VLRQSCFCLRPLRSWWHRQVPLRAARCVPLHTGRDTVGNRIVPLLLNLFDALLQFTCAALRLFLPPMP
jgi:hypothetical protein